MDKKYVKIIIAVVCVVLISCCLYNIIRKPQGKYYAEQSEFVGFIFTGDTVERPLGLGMETAKWTKKLNKIVIVDEDGTEYKYTYNAFNDKIELKDPKSSRKLVWVKVRDGIAE